ncbi:amidase [Amycolatopsis granulosa]|uniref:amidase n=1 Tax=Amycolatopsis granulosa TaxID=185684 RepID=UPI001421EA89|nr:amidase [Amycolatopsis granulosa]
MPVVPPTPEELAELGARYGFHFSEADLKSFTGLVEANLAAHNAVERLYARSAPTAPHRDFSWPGDNPLGAWYVRTRIPPTGDGPLAGREVAVKDNIAVAGVPMMNGSRAVEGFVPRRDATVVSRVLAAGGTIAGKAVCEDLCYSGSSFTSASGPVRNPWDPTRQTGGSSSGNAALLAAGEVDFAIGGDQGGSVRIPAAFCGVVGHKPTHGLVPYTGAFPIETTIDHLGPMTRTVRDAALLLAVLAGDDGYDPRQFRTPGPQDYLAAVEQDIRGLRVGVLTEGFGLPVSEPGVDDAVRAAVDRLAAAGAVVSEVSVPWHRDGFDVWTVIGTDGTARQMIDGNGYGMNVSGRYDPELVVHFAQGRRAHGDAMSDMLKTVILTGAHAAERYDMRHYAMARELAWELRAAYDAALTEVDVLVLPTVPYVAKPLPGPDASHEEKMANALAMVGNTAPFDASGHPAISVPAALVDGLPTGLMIAGRRFDDATVLRVAAAYEREVGGFPAPR